MLSIHSEDELCRQNPTLSKLYKDLKLAMTLEEQEEESVDFKLQES